MQKIHVHIIKMGGTIEFIDPAYDAMNKKLMQLDTTIESYLANVIQPHFNYSTAQFIEEQNLANKKVILTGSMIPITGFTTSDAGFNLGFAIASFASISPGVFLSMNGGIFSADEVNKNEELFRFE